MVLGALGAAVALVLRWPLLLIVATFALAAGRAAADRTGLDPPVPGPVSGWASLVTDPAGETQNVEVEVRLDGRHLLASARGEIGRSLARRAAGQRVLLRGRLSRAPSGGWLTRRHISGLLSIESVDDVGTGPPWVRLANGVRATLESSAAALPERQRGLFLGFVLGDDRAQPLDVIDDFRGAGLSHLLAVSGENVAFVLVLAGPAMRRLRLRPRWLATIGLIGFFALLTRFEPSVLRASTMAALAATAMMLGREASGLRLLALAVAVLVVADPFLVLAAGFQLSVAASAAILLLSGRIAAALPGPRAVAEAVAVSASAQMGVAPLLVITFGGAPVAGLVANLLAAPAAGPVMVWGIAAGIAGGLGGQALAAILHLPTRLLIGWIAVVAEQAARWPLGQLRGGEVVALGLAGVLLSARRRRAKIACSVLVSYGLLAPALGVSAAAPVFTPLAGADLWRDGGCAILVVSPRARPEGLLSGLRQARVRSLDAVVMRGPGGGALLDAISDRATVTRTLSPGQVSAAVRLACGRLDVAIHPSAGTLIAVVTAAAGRGPPCSFPMCS